jgi:hypothetical protein
VGNAGVIANVLVPGTSVTVNAVVGVIAAPATAVTVCVEGVIEGAARTGDTESGANSETTESATTIAIIFLNPDLTFTMTLLPSLMKLSNHC